MKLSDLMDCLRRCFQKTDGAVSGPQEQTHADILGLIRELQRKEDVYGTIREMGVRIALGEFSSCCRLIYGVWVDEVLYYEAFGVPLGSPPKNRPDAKDRCPGIPEGAFSACMRCKISWKWAKGHSTYWNDNAGLFPLCEHCWSALSPEQRLPFYLDLLNLWEQQGVLPEDREGIIRAVLDGK